MTNLRKKEQNMMPRCITYLFVAAISAIHLEWAGPASLWVKGGAEADVVSGCGANER